MVLTNQFGDLRVAKYWFQFVGGFRDMVEVVDALGFMENSGLGEQPFPADLNVRYVDADDMSLECVNGIKIDRHIRALAKPLFKGIAQGN